MAVGYKLPDGRDFDDVFTLASGSLTTGYKISNGTDIGARYLSGLGAAVGITTGYKNSAGTDLGGIFTKATVSGTASAGTTMTRISKTYTTNKDGDTSECVMNRYAVSPGIAIPGTVLTLFRVYNGYISTANSTCSTSTSGTMFEFTMSSKVTTTYNLVIYVNGARHDVPVTIGAFTAKTAILQSYLSNSPTNITRGGSYKFEIYM